MKKIISLALSFTLILSIFNISVYAVEDTTSKDDIEGFCEELTEMVNDYEDSEFITPEVSVAKETEELLGEETEINFCSRLIVQSNEEINTYNAVDVVNGFSNFFVVQFENEDDTNYAYEQYSKDEKIISVYYDVSYNALETVTEEPEEETPAELTYEDYKNGWYLSSTGIDAVLERYKDDELPEIVVAVIDTGYDFNNNYFSDRIIKTNYNNTREYDENSEQDYNGHGTMVTSMILNCTTDNVKVANYRIIKEDGTFSSITMASLGILRAVKDGVDVINCSFTAFGADNYFKEVIKYAYDNECAIFASAGNQNTDIERGAASALNMSEYTVVVGSHDMFNEPSDFSVKGKFVNVFAPGEDVPLITLDNVVKYTSGTSFSSPFMASVYAMYCATHTKNSFSERIRILKCSGDGTFEKYRDDYYGSGNINALKLFGLDTIKEPIFSHNEFKYDGPVSLELYAEDGAQIYYTTDGTYPAKSNGTLYTTPIEFENTEIRIRAVAYKSNEQSNCVTKDFVSNILGTDDMFEITEDGMISYYSGDIECLKIPDKVNGITVLEIQYGAFRSGILKSVTLPDTVEYLGKTYDCYDRVSVDDEQRQPFNGCEDLKYIWGNNIKVLGYQALTGAKKLREVFFPNCEYIFKSACYLTSLIAADFPKVKSIENSAFNQCASLRAVYLPECERIGYEAFNAYGYYNKTACSPLRNFYAPKANFMETFASSSEVCTLDSAKSTQYMFKNSFLMRLDLPNMETIGEGFFQNTAIKILELSNVKYLHHLPVTGERGTYYCDYYLPVTIELLLPSTLQYALSAENFTTYPDLKTYCVYGTKGTYAEEWAKENEIEFIEITQETSIREDIEPIWDEWSYKPLEFDARGFNRTYQWYGYNGTKKNAVAINGATDKIFNPEDYNQYQYYYCEMTSVDGDSVVNVTSGTCQNKLYEAFAMNDSFIDYEKNLIYTQESYCKNIFNIVAIQSDVDYTITPSYSNDKFSLYGTGTQVVFTESDGSVKIYTIIVQGDVNGDSVVDVFDLMDIELTMNNFKDLEGCYNIAADVNMDEQISIEDFSSVVNLALNKGG